MDETTTPARKVPTTVLDALLEAVGFPERDGDEAADAYAARVGQNAAAKQALLNGFQAAATGDRQTAAAQIQSALELQADPNPPDAHPRHK